MAKNLFARIQTLFLAVLLMLKDSGRFQFLGGVLAGKNRTGKENFLGDRFSVFGFQFGEPRTGVRGWEILGRGGGVFDYEHEHEHDVFFALLMNANGG